MSSTITITTQSHKVGSSNRTIDSPHRQEKMGITGRPNNIEATTVTLETGMPITKNPTHLPSSEVETASKMASKLLELPAEIREQIWRNILTSSTGFVKPIWGEKKKSIIHLHTFDKNAKLKDRERISLNILYTTKQIYHECAPIFWDSNKFILNPEDDFLTPSLLKENILTSSFCRKIKHVQLDIYIARPIIFESKDTETEAECDKKLRTALAIMEKMADPTQGFVKTLAFKPVSNLLGLEMVLDAAFTSVMHLRKLNKIFNVLEGMNACGTLERAEVKRSVEIDIGWDEKTDLEKRCFVRHYNTSAHFLLGSLAVFMGGIDRKLFMDGKFCSKRVDGKLEMRADLFPLKAVEENLDEAEEEFDAPTFEFIV